ncbi:hypothetical protein CBS101457_001466 [Exobasidium rhododendri]|nr:hypothetical protein CBS101457_001466 [Exobasidium rhododendri]
MASSTIIGTAPPSGAAIVGTSGSTDSTLGWIDPPPSLELAQVHYLIRHGERTPVRTRLLKASPPIPARWNMCHAGKNFRAAIVDFGEGSDVQVRNWKGEAFQGARQEIPIKRRVEATNDKENILPLESGECFLGELTDLGRASTHLIGSRLRSLYTDKLGFLPQKLDPKDNSTLYFRSTNMSRTVESLQSIIRGLMPQTLDTSVDGYIPTILVRNGISENLLPNTFGCGRLRDLDREFSKLAAHIHNPRLSSLDAILSPQLEGALPRVDGHPRLNGILDTVRASKAHGIVIPSVFEDEKVMKQVEEAVVDEWYIGYRAEDAATRQQYRRLAMGRFLDDLSHRLNEKADKPSTPLKLAVYSAHDTSLAGLLSTLDVFDNRWPAFTASLGLELFRKKDGSGGILGRLGLKKDEHYVRMRYGNETLKLPACSKVGNHLEGAPEYCTLQAFTDAVKGLHHPKGMTWEQECDEDRATSSDK